jgi:hypothetical protein
MTMLGLPKSSAWANFDAFRAKTIDRQDSRTLVRRISVPFVGRSL